MGTENIGAIPFSGIILAHSNEAEWQTFKANKNNEAFIDRICVIKVPYCLRATEEQKIYEKLIQGSELASAPCAPSTLETLARFSVMSRLRKHGKPVYLKYFGVRDVATRQPMTADTIFALHSMTKPITSVAAMMLVDAGKLSPADPASKYIPAFADVKVGVGSVAADGAPVLKLAPLDRPVTVKDLLRHTSGITYDYIGGKLIDKAYVDSGLFDGTYDNKVFAERIAKLPLARQPGTLWRYGHSTDVVGRIIEIISGKTLYQFEKQHIFDPLGMSTPPRAPRWPASVTRTSYQVGRPWMLEGKILRGLTGTP